MPSLQLDRPCRSPAERIHLALSFLQKEYGPLTPLGSAQSTFALAKLFQSIKLTPLHIYQTASFLQEGQLREIVQFLSTLGPHVASTAVRLLIVMRGLPGNWELTSDFIDLQQPYLSSFDARTFAFLGLLGGRKLMDICDIKPILNMAFHQYEEDARFALCAISEMQYQGTKESVLRVHTWATEHHHATSASFWRELEWAAYTRSLCVSSSATPLHTQPSTFPSEPSSVPDFEAISTDCESASDHYLRICGILMRRRRGHRVVTPSAISQSSTPMHDQTVITPSLRPVLRDAAAAIAYGIPLLLQGPSGCGKTSLISLLASQTLYTTDKNSISDKLNAVTYVQMDSAMSESSDESVSSLIGGIVPLPEGGGFRWRPGPIGLAVQRGHWVVFENIGNAQRTSSSAPIIRQLAALQPGDALDAPGRGEPICVGRGFRCIATHTVQALKDKTWQPPGGWDLWFPVEIPQLSNEDSSTILQERFPLVKDCIERVVKCISEVAKYTATRHGPLFRSPSLREAVRICTRLEAVRSNGAVLTPETALLETLDVLVNWCSNDADQEALLASLSACWSLSCQVGKNVLYTNYPSFSIMTDSLQIGRAAMRRFADIEGSVSPRLALNGHVLRLMERTLRSLQMNENVLLTGEAGSGKTAAIQEIASLLRKKLVVVNLSRQSELGDLLGGFRPVEVSTAVTTLARRFESAFCGCMSREKNVRFLAALQRACRSSAQHGRALRLMNGAMKAVPTNVKRASESSLREWDEISFELQSLEKSLSPGNLVNRLNDNANRNVYDTEPPKKRARLAPQENSSVRRVNFKFYEGALPQAMRQGHWLLLDEINLAPSELLERLISVVDNGQILLSNEKGEVVSQSPGFALFGSMNPPTDVGKRPLPASLRVRFSEFFVGDISDKNDVVRVALRRFFNVSHTVAQSLQSSSLEMMVSHDVASFFLESCRVAKAGHIEDVNGKPVRFSIRHLSRMLDFASGVQKHLNTGMEGVRLCLYEGAVLSFATSLPRESRHKITTLAEEFLRVKLKESMKQRGKIKSNRRGFVDLLSALVNSMTNVVLVEGFPLEVKPSTQKVETSKSRFIVSPTVRKTLSDVCRAMTIGAPNTPIMLQGPTAAGKTSLVRHLAELTGNNLIRINNHEHTDIAEYIGSYVATEDGSLVFREGPLVKAARHGNWILLDELNLAPPDVLESLNRLLDDNREIFLSDTGEVVKASPQFRLFATQNPPGLYGGRKELSRAFRSRFLEVNVGDLPDEDLLIILQSISRIPQSFATKMVSVMRELQLRRKTSSMFTGREGFVTVRDLFRWSSRQARSKDELAIHGFFLLGERAREIHERGIVRDVLIEIIGVSANILRDDVLYSLSSGSTPEQFAAQECLELSMEKIGMTRERLVEAISSHDIVLTSHMLRMIILLIHCIANNEPALLVGATGGGKTSSCAAVCAAVTMKLLTVNCHRHTEAADILGGFRPVRERERSGALFEWCNGPLVAAMKDGNCLLIDEINMADDAVIERLNSVLEIERTLLLSEKGNVRCNDSDSVAPELVLAEDRFRLLATMNPGGDFGKKELSPALRNRFTELWIPQPSSIEEFLPVVKDRLKSLEKGFNSHSESLVVLTLKNFLTRTLQDKHEDPVTATKDSTFQSNGPSFVISMRDLTSWCDFIVRASTHVKVDPLLSLVHGARLVFLDGLSVGSSNPDDHALERWAWGILLSLLPDSIRGVAESLKYSNDDISLIHVDSSDDICLMADCFPVKRRIPSSDHSNSTLSSLFSFDAPNTTRNTIRIARAMSVGNIPILMEGPPGGGKSSLVAALARISGNTFVRVNLSESTEMSDLVGTDAPGEEQGSFVFRKGPLLQALMNGWWILLDELNLASQSVLEGLNSVLDHRRSLFVPELNKELIAHPHFRVFGAQNPAVHGGGRRGLPKSFLNRFAKVWIESPRAKDLLAITCSLFPRIPKHIILKIIEVLEDVKSKLNVSANSQSGSSCLRDALRWCDLVEDVALSDRASTGSSDTVLEMCVGETFDAIVLQSLPSSQDRAKASSSFERVFGLQWQHVDGTPSANPNQDGSIRIGLSLQSRKSDWFPWQKLEPHSFVLLRCRLRELQALSFALDSGWPAVLFSECTSTTRYVGLQMVEALALSCGKKVHVFQGGNLSDFDDFVGGYSQQDFIRSIRTTVRSCLDVLDCAVRFCLQSYGQNNPVNSELFKLHKMAREQCVLLEAHSSNEAILPLVSKLSESMKSFEASASKLLGARSDELGKLHDNLLELEGLASSMERGEFATFKWRKSELLNTIERGDWIFLEDADSCPPAILDRLNPLFERSPVSLKERKANGGKHQARVILAEAPSRADGSPVYLNPHPDFRMVFAMSTDGGRISSSGLSKALLDRSLQIYVGHELQDRDISTISSCHGSRSLLNTWREAQFKNIDSQDVADPSAAAQRCRFTCAALTSVVHSEDSLDINSTTLSAKSDSQPRTVIANLVTHPIMSLIERDITFVRYLESMSSEAILQHIGKNAKKFSYLFLGVAPRDSKDILMSNLFRVAVECFLMASSSAEELNWRCEALRSVFHSSGECPSQYQYGLDVITQTTSLLSSSKFMEVMKLPSSRFSALPIDPLFAMDRLSILFLEAKDSLIIQAWARRAKYFRMELLALQGFRSTWHRALRSSGASISAEASQFAEAKTAFDLRESGLKTFSQIGNIPLLAFEIVKYVGDNADSLAEIVMGTSGWEDECEIKWLELVYASQSLCVALSTNSKEVMGWVLLSLNCVQELSSINSVGFPSSLHKLCEKGSRVVTPIWDSINQVSRSRMPRTTSGLELEKKLHYLLSPAVRDQMSFSELDAACKALVSLRCENVESESIIVRSISALVGQLNKSIESKPDLESPVSMSHWSPIEQLYTAKMLLGAALLISSKGLLMEKSLPEFIRNAVYYVKCAPKSSVQSILAIQGIQWLLDSEDDRRNSVSFHEWKAFECGLLKELTSFFDREKSTDDFSTFGVSSSVLKQAQDPLCSFWDLPNCLRESFSAMRLVLQGLHGFSEIVKKSQALLPVCLTSALVDAGFDVGNSSSVSGSLLGQEKSRNVVQYVTTTLRKDTGIHDNECTNIAFSAANQVGNFLNFDIQNDSPFSMLRSAVLLGSAWVSIGVLRLKAFLVFVEGHNGYDPSLIAESIMESCRRGSIFTGTSAVAYDKICQVRLGGDNPQNSVPVQRMTKRLDEFVSLFQVAQRRHVERPTKGTSFESMETTLRAFVMYVIRAICNNDIISQLACDRESIRTKAIQECVLLRQACSSFLRKLECPGPLSHFRDISLDGILAVEEIILGLVVCEEAACVRDKIDVDVSREAIKHFQDVARFPRAAYTEALSCDDAVRSCVENSTDADSLFAFSSFLILQEMNSSNFSVAAVSHSFEYISEEWKRTRVREEDELELKSSLHVIREASDKQEINGMSYSESLEVDEEYDFSKTFQPLDAEDDEALLGVSQDRHSENIDARNLNEASAERLLKINEENFCALYMKCFPGNGQDSINTRSWYHLIATHILPRNMFSSISNIACILDIIPNVWTFFSSAYVLQRFRGMEGDISNIDREESMYNFYTDANPEEMMNASQALVTLQRAIVHVQVETFSDMNGHPVLAEISSAVKRVAKTCTSSEPLAKVVVGIENVLRKADQWHRHFAMKKTRLDDEVTGLSRLVVKWRGLEMSSWRFLLEAREREFQCRGRRWFFLLFDAVVNHAVNAEVRNDETAREILSAVDRFLRSSPLGEFSSRRELICSLAHHLSLIASGDSYITSLGRMLNLVGMYYKLFAASVNLYKTNQENIVFKKLKEFQALVSWAPERDLGSSQTMSKEQNKDLDYFRLKAASEKTRRKLHKLCLEIDCIYRLPVYDILSKEMTKLGIQAISADGDLGGTDDNSLKVRFSKRIPDAVEDLQVTNREALPIEEDVEVPVIRQAGTSRKVDLILKKISDFGIRLIRSKRTMLDHGANDATRLRELVRQRVSDLSSTQNANIQGKKRAIATLLKELSHIGLSPFESSVPSERRSPAFWFRTPEPSKSKIFNDLADELFLMNASQIRRLGEVSDSRVRHADFSTEEACKSRSLCASLFDQVCLQRTSLNHSFSVIASLDSSVLLLENLPSEGKELTARSWTLPNLMKLKNLVSRLECIALDFEIVEGALTTSTHVLTSTLMSGKLPVTPLRTLLREKVDRDSDGNLAVFSAVLRSSIEAVRGVLGSKCTRIVLSAPERHLSMFSNTIHDACSETRVLLSGLYEKLRSSIPQDDELNQDSMLYLILQPTVDLLSSFENSLNSPKRLSNPVPLRDTVLKTRELVGNIVERVLIATQEILTWSGINAHQEEWMESLNSDSREFQWETVPKSLKGSHMMVSSFVERSRLLSVVSLLSTTEAYWDSVAQSISSLPEVEVNEVVRVMRTLGSFLRSFLSSIIVPCARKLGEFHCQSLSLLRTLTSLFIGLCEEGYCRPPESEAGEVEESTELKSGTGFGDAGDGDMSGAQDVSDEIEDEEQLIGLQGEERNDSKPNPENEEQEPAEGGFEMETDFEGDLEDAPKPDEGPNEEDEDDSTEKQMSGEKGMGDDIVDEKLWNKPDESEDGRQDEGANDQQNQAEAAAGSDLVAKNDDDTKNDPDKSKDEHPDRKKSAAQVDDNAQDDELKLGEDKEDVKETEKNKKRSLSEPEIELPHENDENDEHGNDKDDDDDPDGEQNAEGDDSQMKSDQSQAKNLDEHEENQDKNDEPDGLDPSPASDVDNDSSFKDDQRNSEGQDTNEIEDGSKDNDETMTGNRDVNMVDSLNDNDNEDEDGENDLPEDLNLEKSREGDENEADDNNAIGDGDEPGDDDGMDNDDRMHSGVERDNEATDPVEAIDTEQTTGEATSAPRNADGEGQENPNAFRTDKPSEMRLSGEQQFEHGNNGSGDNDGGVDSAGPTAPREGINTATLEKDHSASDEEEQLQRHNDNDPNPFRKVTTKELEQQWKRVIEELEYEQKKPQQQPGAKEANLWEFSMSKEEKEGESMALAAATEEQQREQSIRGQEKGDGDDDELRPEGIAEVEELKPLPSPEEKQESHGTVPSRSKDNCTEVDREQGDELKDRSNEEKLAEHPAVSIFNSSGEALEQDRSEKMDSINYGEQPMDCVQDKFEDEEKEDEPIVEEETHWLIEKLDVESSCKLWSNIEAKVSHSAGTLCEQLRMLLEPTMSSSLAGGYRTGKRLNMRKVIEYVASDFRKDRIWLRRVKPDKRTYDVLLAIDDSESMTDSGAGAMAIESLTLVTSALAKLEVGRVAVVSFGSDTRLVRDFDESLPLSVDDGGKMLRNFSFSQKETNVVKLMEFISSKLILSTQGEHMTLAFIVSDGKLSNREEIRRHLRSLKEANVLVAFLILDKTGSDDQKSIFDVKQVEFAGGKPSVKPYLQDFPIDFYAVVQDVKLLPSVFADALRQWIEATLSQLN